MELSCVALHLLFYDQHRSLLMLLLLHSQTSCLPRVTPRMPLLCPITGSHYHTVVAVAHAVAPAAVPPTCHTSPAIAVPGPLSFCFLWGNGKDGAGR